MTRPSPTQVNGDTRAGADGGLPPSTLAAQLVEHQNAANGNVQTDKTTFRQLLNEIRASPNAVEADPDGNRRLITVVAEAGLQVPAARDPFVRPEDEDDQAIACLEVIEIALRKTPAILMYDVRNTRVHDALCWLLLSKVTALMTISSLQNPLRRLLRIISRILIRAPGCWRDYYLWQQILIRAAAGKFDYSYILHQGSCTDSSKTRKMPWLA